MKRLLRAVWGDAGRLGVERFGFPEGSIRQAAVVATLVCWTIAGVLIWGLARG